jgi:hypothetical protein
VRHLTAALAARGHAVRLAPDGGKADVAVAINDARLLPAGAGRAAVWFHNEVALWREVRRGRLGSMWRARPAAVFCGTRQARLASRLLPFGRRLILPHGLPTAILRAEPARQPPPPEVIFTSQAYRGLAGVITLWRQTVAPANPAARLCAYVAPADLGRFAALAEGIPSISILPRVANTAMPGLLRAARVLVAPGHPSETFCLAAAEAVAMGVPVVTFGHGALAERVEDGNTGFLCRNAAHMAHRILTLLDNDALWARMHGEGPARREGAGWDDVAALWERAFLHET